MNPLHHAIRRHDGLYAAFAVARDLRDRATWNLRRRRMPPPGVVKRQLLRQYRRWFKLHTLVETGTFLGDTLWALRHEFHEIHSVELDLTLYRLAGERFRHLPHVHLYHGNSAELLPRILDRLREPALFWLDGHYSGPGTARAEFDSPLVTELREILLRPLGHVVLIDDARLLTGSDGYPTVSELRAAATAGGGLVDLKWDTVAVTPAARRPQL